MVKTFKATARKLKKSLQVETESRGFKILLDEPKNLGGTDTAMTPVEAVLCAFGACQAIVASAFAKSQGFTFEELYVELEGDLDTDGFLGLADVRNGFQEIRYVLHFKTKETQEKAEAFADFIESRCPVGDCLAHGVKLVKSGVVID